MTPKTDPSTRRLGFVMLAVIYILLKEANV